MLPELIGARRPSSETYGLLGRVYKDRWDTAAKRASSSRAAACSTRRSTPTERASRPTGATPIPGVNAVTLMEIRNPPDPRRIELLPVVRYAAARRIAAGNPDYWDHATRARARGARGGRDAGDAALSDALAAVREPWEPESTANNLRLIREAREERGRDVDMG